MNSEQFTSNPTFSHNGETLSLIEIAQAKTITSLSFGYNSKEKNVSVGGLLGFFGKKKAVQEERELAIEDRHGISLLLSPEGEAVTIKFWHEKEFNKVANDDYDERTLQKRFIMSIGPRYEMSFHVGNLKSIAWQ